MTGFQCAGLTCFVITVHTAFAIPGGAPHNYPVKFLSITNSYARAGSYSVLYLRTAQPTLASLLATATAALFLPLLSLIRLIQRLKGSSRPTAWRTTVRAPWTRSLRRYRSPRLLIPNRRLLPPLLYCLGTNPRDAAACRPLA